MTVTIPSAPVAHLGSADDAEGDDASVAPSLASEDLAALIRRLRRVEGQVGGLIRMLESGRDCADVVTQLAAASRALDRVGFLLVTSQLRECVQRQADGDGSAEGKAAALEKLFLMLA